MDYDELVHGNIMGRIAVALFGDQNNRTDEECVARSAEIGYQLTGTQQALFQAQEAVKMLASEVAALRDQEKFNETALKGYRNNIDDLKHDIARHIQITADQAQEMEKLRQDLAAALKINIKLVGAIDMIRETLNGGDVQDLLFIINNALGLYNDQRK